MPIKLTDAPAIPNPESGPSWKSVLLCFTIIVAACAAAYLNSFSVPFLLDDADAIADNPSIQKLWPPVSALNPPSGGETVTGRPVINYSLAVNYALSRLDVRGYHVFNLLVHMSAALVLFGIVRRTLRQPSLAGRFDAASVALPLVIALWWALHPLQTESVAYIVQRAESLMGLFYLLTLYTAIRALDAKGPMGWQCASVFFCLMGMASKEVMVSAPLIVLLYDRTFATGSFLLSWQKRKWFYLSLAATWLLLFWLIIVQGGGSRGESCGFGTAVTGWEYFCTQAEGILRYLKLTIWPHPLIFDYGVYVAHNTLLIALCMLTLGALGVATIIAVWRVSPWGFLGAAFFAILGPSSSFIPVGTQTLAEHRMYLPLVVVVVSVAFGLQKFAKRAFLPVGLGFAALLGWVTLQRNHDYRSVVAIWEDTVAKQPEQARARCNLGAALTANPDRLPDAVMHLQEAIRIDPNYAEAHSNLGMALLQTPGRAADAIAACETAVRIISENFGSTSNLSADSGLARMLARACNNLGAALADNGRTTEAMPCFQRAIALNPGMAEAHGNLAGILMQTPALHSEAVVHLEKALALAPDLVEPHVKLSDVLSHSQSTISAAVSHLEKAEAMQPRSAKIWNNIAVIWARIPNRQEKAVHAYETALSFDPQSWSKHLNFAVYLTSIPGHSAEAIRHFEEVVRLAPDNRDAHTNLAILLIDLPNHFEESVKHFEIVARANPDSHDAQYNLGTALSRIPSRQLEAKKAFQEALRIDPNDAEAHNNLGLIVAQLPDQTPEAIKHFKAALSLKPGLAEAHFNLAKTLAAASGGRSEAIRHLEKALELTPDYGEARALLSSLTTGPKP